jgi:hypothetical protein
MIRETPQTQKGKASKEHLSLPKFDYHLDESDPDVVVLRRQDGGFVAAFSVRGVTKESIVRAAEEDYGACSSVGTPAS